MLRAVALLLLSLLSCATARAQISPQAREQLSRALADGDSGQVSRAAAIAGTAVAGLMLGGTLAIELANRPDSEKITRGLHLGVTVLAAPAVAFASYMKRRRGLAQGSAPLRAMGWVFYSAAIGIGVAQWYDVLHDQRVRPSLGVLYGSLALLSLLPHCFDAYLTSREVGIRRFLVTPGGISARF